MPARKTLAAPRRLHRYSIAHDLHAPLSSNDGFSKMLEQAAGSNLPEPARKRWTWRHWPVRPWPRAASVRRIAQVMGNLVGNASKFTAKKDRARIEIGSMPGAAGSPFFFVRDNGAGFDMAHASRMLDAIQRMHSLAQFGGTGIGLAIVHRVG